jgi:hypothetical protein
MTVIWEVLYGGQDIDNGKFDFTVS